MIKWKESPFEKYFTTDQIFPTQIFSRNPVVLKSIYESKPTEKREQYNGKALKNFDGF